MNTNAPSVPPRPGGGRGRPQFSPVKPLRRRALQRRIRREADFISSPARGMDPEVLIQDDDALDDLVRKHNNLIEELEELDEPARRGRRPPSPAPTPTACPSTRSSRARRCATS